MSALGSRDRVRVERTKIAYPQLRAGSTIGCVHDERPVVRNGERRHTKSIVLRKCDLRHVGEANVVTVGASAGGVGVSTHEEQRDSTEAERCEGQHTRAQTRWRWCRYRCRREGRATRVAQRRRKLRRTGKPVGGQLRQCRAHGLLDHERHGIAQRVNRRRLLAQYFRDNRVHAATRERRVAGKHFVQHGAQRIPITSRIDDAFAHRLLGTHVLRRTKTQPRLRHALAARALHRACNADVGNERAAIVQQNVLGLDVAMDHAVPVRVVQRTRDLTCDAQRVGDGELPLAFQSRAKRLASHQWHHVVQQPVGLAAVEERQNVRMLQARRGADFGQEAVVAMPPASSSRSTI